MLQRDFGALWWGQLISLWGDRLNYLALNGLVQQHTRDYHDPGQSSLMLSLHGTVSVLPVLLFAPFAGPWVDRWDLRRTWRRGYLTFKRPARPAHHPPRVKGEPVTAPTLHPSRRMPVAEMDM